MWRLFQFSKFHENVGKLHKGNFKRFDHDIQGQKFIKLMEKVAKNFASLFFVGN